MNVEYTPERITELGEKEVFVFGSNLAGRHAGGAARTALRRFGAILGQGVGLQGRSYAIPTMHGGVDEIRPYVDEFVEFARKRQDLTFYVTKIGCGIAGFRVEEMAPLFREAITLPNVKLPKEFADCIKMKNMSHGRLDDIEIEKNRLKICTILLSTHRNGMHEVIKYLDDSGYFTAPGSKHGHHSWKGGLAEHSLGVWEKAMSKDTGLRSDSIAICSLLHDVCKARKMYVDDDGNIHTRATHIKGHGYRSIKLLNNCGLELTEDERLAIRWHMGGHLAKEDEMTDMEKARKSPLWKLIHEADGKDAMEK